MAFPGQKPGSFLLSLSEVVLVVAPTCLSPRMTNYLSNTANVVAALPLKLELWDFGSAASLALVAKGTTYHSWEKKQ